MSDFKFSAFDYEDALQYGEPLAGRSTAPRIKQPTDGSYGTLEITGIEANLLLFLLDDYIAGKWRVGKTIEGYNPEDLQGLRDRLFAAHEHPKE